MGEEKIRKKKTGKKERGRGMGLGGRDNVVYWKTNGKINFDLQYRGAWVLRRAGPYTNNARST